VDAMGSSLFVQVTNLFFVVVMVALAVGTVVYLYFSDDDEEEEVDLVEELAKAAGAEELLTAIEGKRPQRRAREEGFLEVFCRDRGFHHEVSRRGDQEVVRIAGELGAIHLGMVLCEEAIEVDLLLPGEEVDLFVTAPKGTPGGIESGDPTIDALMKIETGQDPEDVRRLLRGALGEELIGLVERSRQVTLDGRALHAEFAVTLKSRDQLERFLRRLEEFSEAYEKA